MKAQLASYMPTEAPVYRATGVDYARWAQEGVKGLVWDVEGTLGQRGAEELDADMVDVIRRAREAGIPYHALVTNKSANNRQSQMLLDGWQEQTGADAVFWPEERSWRKPSACMPLQAMAEFDLTPRQMGAVGDKATADMVAAYRAGFNHRAWTRAIEGNEHPGDALLRRPIEVGLRLQAHLQLSPTFEAIVSNDSTNNSSKHAKKELPTDATELQKFLFEHGRDVASALTYSRILLASGIVAVGISSLDPATKRNINALLVATAYLTDYLDGKASRADKDGATADGALADQSIDKILSAVTDIFGLLPDGLITATEVAIPIIRDAGMTALRGTVRKRGIDTASVMAGKRATAFKGGVQLTSLAFGSQMPRANRVLQTAAVGYKLSSAVTSVDSWLQTAEHARHERIRQMNLNQM